MKMDNDKPTTLVEGQSDDVQTSYTISADGTRVTLRMSVAGEQFEFVAHVNSEIGLRARAAVMRALLGKTPEHQS